jgi:hypothetical protein
LVVTRNLSKSCIIIIYPSINMVVVNCRLVQISPTVVSLRVCSQTQELEGAGMVLPNAAFQYALLSLYRPDYTRIYL